MVIGAVSFGRQMEPHVSEREGVIQYQLAFIDGPPEPASGLPELIAWRKILRLVGMLGQDPDRYAGLGFGNLSLRLEGGKQQSGQPRFAISGSQTGHLADVGPEHFATVTGWDVEDNRVEARGPTRPSSETMTHAVIYEADDDVRCVMHVHSPEIWRHARDLDLFIIPRTATYGTPAMAREVQQIVRTGPTRRLGVMQGHEDGVIAWGASVEAPGVLLLTTLARAYQLGK